MQTRHQAGQPSSAMAFLRGLTLVALPFLARGDASALRGAPTAEAICTGDGKLPGGPACYGNSVASNSFSVKVVSVEGDSGTVNMEATGSSFFAECQGAHFQNAAGSITVDSDQQCGLLGYEYTVQYCSDQDQLIVHLIQPYASTVVLPSTTCAGEI